jgi:type I restriction enzyme S subunit
MRSEWKTVPIESLCLGIYDGPHATPKKTESGPIFLGISSLNSGQLDLSNIEHLSEEDFSKWTKRVTPQAGDIVFSYETRLGQVAIIPSGFRCCLGRRMALMRADPEKVTSNYLLYAYLSPDFQEVIRQRTIHGSTVDRIPLVEFGSFSITVPSLEIQDEVVGVLRALDDRITLLRETNATLEAIAQALFKSWFVDFDPVRAKMQGRAPEGMDEATAALFPDGFEESELGLVPSGWRVMPIGDAVNSVGGTTPDTKNPMFWEPALHCWTTPKDLSGIAAPVLLNTERKLSEQGLAKIGSGLLPVGTLLLSSRAPIGYMAVTQVPLAINQGYIAMPPKGLLPPLYMLFWCRENMDVIKGRANGSTFMEISKKAFRPIPALVPSLHIIQKFVETADAVFDRLIENEKQAQSLATLRDTLLPRLISGQLRLTETETTN